MKKEKPNSRGEENFQGVKMWPQDRIIAGARTGDLHPSPVSSPSLSSLFFSFSYYQMIRAKIPISMLFNLIIKLCELFLEILILVPF